MRVVFSDKAEKQFLRLDKAVQTQIKKFILKLQELEDPRERGKRLVGNFSGFWRYRVGDYRILCRIQDDALEILVVEVGHRKNVYGQ
ncbi:MAG: type II toxin-antitoxin system RelE/ParE family toxin [Treponema sp.]|nr:type II toxin-antitoxin system RelE/ParE family toxin [Treponema sp.]